jgi:hypothetical protein
MDGIELAYTAKRLTPNIHLVVTSGNTLTKDLPDGALFLPKPWLPLDDCRRRNAATSSNQEARCGTESVNVIAVGGHQQISLSPRNHSDAMAALRGRVRSRNHPACEQNRPLFHTNFLQL